MELRKRPISFDESTTPTKIKNKLGSDSTWGEFIDYIEENKEDDNTWAYGVETFNKELSEAVDRKGDLDAITQLVRKTAIAKSVISIVLSILFLFAGGYFIYKFLLFSPDVIAEIDLTNSLDVINSAPFWQFVVYVLYLIIGFVLILFGLNALKINTLLRDFSGISHIQHEILSGIGESRPLIQVIQETLTNAKKTFTQSLITSKAMFWTGLVFIVIALFQVLVLGNTSYSNVQVDTGAAALATGTTGGIGIFAWIVSTFLTQRKKMQENLNNITQLEFALVGFSKQLSLVDLFVSGDTNGVRLEKAVFEKSIQEVSDKTRRSLALVELYTKEMKEDENSDTLKNEVKSVLGIE